MTWFFLALLGPLLHAVSSHIDRCLMQRYFTEDGAAIVLVVTSIFAGLAAPVFWVMAPDGVQMGWLQLATIGAVAGVNTAGLWAYLTALEEEDTTVVIVLYQLVPVFGLALGHGILGETIGLRQLLATAVILLGALLVLLDHVPGRVLRIRRRTLILMVPASAALALAAVLFKVAAVDETAWPALFWLHLAYLVLGIGMIAAVSSLRRQFLDLLSPGRRTLLAFNAVNEVVFISGNVALSLAFVLAPVSLVLLAVAVEPVFVLLIALVLPVIWRAAPRERLGGAHLIQKTVAIMLTGWGSYILLSMPAT